MSGISVHSANFRGIRGRKAEADPYNEQFHGLVGPDVALLQFH